MGDWTGTVPTFTTGAKLRGVDQQTLADIATALTGVWTSYTVTLSGSAGSPAIGDGTVTGKYRRLGKTVDVVIILTRGSTTTFGTGYPRFNLPATAANANHAGACTLQDVSANSFAAACHLESTTVVIPMSASGVVTNTVPFTWATGDIIRITMTYEAA
jgi:hypothetical protein